jgi:hypothetical protein
MTTSEQINEIAAALAKAQGAMKPAAKDASNPAFKRGGKESKYADLAANVEAARQPLAINGLSVVQEATMSLLDNTLCVECSTRLMHSSGQWLQFDPLTVPMMKPDAHGVGSALTYARRYALGAVLGLVAEDDDGNTAAGASAQPQQRTRSTAPDGFEQWWDDMVAAADEGETALKNGWAASNPDMRRYVASEHKQRWEELKSRAASVPVTA